MLYANIHSMLFSFYVVLILRCMNHYMLYYLFKLYANIHLRCMLVEC